MPSTTTHGLPVPVSTDAPAGHTQMTTLAASIDAQLLTTVTSLPGSPVDGQRCLYLADATNGVVWDLRYRSASGSTFKWEFVGGGDLTATVATQESTSTGAFADLTTVGPSITVPLAGDYLVRFGARIGPQANSQSYMAPALGATAAATANAIRAATQSGGTAYLLSYYAELPPFTLAASDLVRLKYQSGGAGVSASYENRVLAVRPRRVG